MITAQSTKITPFTAEPVRLRELEYIGFSGQHEIAHGLFRSLPREKWGQYASKHLLSAVIAGGITKLRKYLGASAEEAAHEEKTFIDAVVTHFVQACRANRTSPRELFESLLLWSNELTRLSLLPEALRLYDDMQGLGVNKYPDISVRTLLGKADLLSTLGKFQQAQALLSPLVERPYIVPDRNLIPDIIYSLGKISLQNGQAEYYKGLLFRGLRVFYSGLESRQRLTEQLRKTYRRSRTLLLDRNVGAANKALYLIHWITFKAQDSRPLRALRLPRLLRLILLAYVYWINYARRKRPRPTVIRSETLRAHARRDREDGGSRAASSEQGAQKILITRAMGGIGDLLMMTPGIHVLKRKYPCHQIHMAVPRRYFPLFQENPDVTLLDVEDGVFDVGSYSRWFNLTDCPAARVESRTAPRVRKSRVQIFARALGAASVRVFLMDKRPRYVVTEEEREFKKTFWKEHGLEAKTVVGIQFRSEESYRDYPHMERLVRAVARHRPVLVFDAERIEGLDGENIITVTALPMRRAFALASGCDAIIAPDSAFVHLSAALDIPCVALYGPIDGTVRAKHYPKCTVIDVRQRLRCLPCWRNEQITCALTNMRGSVCMADISITEIMGALDDHLRRRTAL